MAESSAKRKKKCLLNSTSVLMLRHAHALSYKRLFMWMSVLITYFLNFSLFSVFNDILTKMRTSTENVSVMSLEEPPSHRLHPLIYPPYGVWWVSYSSGWNGPIWGQLARVDRPLKHSWRHGNDGLGLGNWYERKWIPTGDQINSNEIKWVPNHNTELKVNTPFAIHTQN